MEEEIIEFAKNPILPNAESPFKRIYEEKEAQLNEIEEKIK
jgi:hypothetical protein